MVLVPQEKWKAHILILHLKVSYVRLTLLYVVGEFYPSSGRHRSREEELMTGFYTYVRLNYLCLRVRILLIKLY